MTENAVQIFNDIVKQYDASIHNLGVFGIAFAKETYSDLILIAVAAIYIGHLLRKQVDVAEANCELFGNLLYLYFFFLLIWHFNDIPLIQNFFATFKAAGIKMSGATSNPGDIVNIGLGLIGAVLTSAKQLTGLTHFGIALMADASALIIGYCFGFIAIELTIIDIGGRIILAAGLFMLGFAASPWTKTYAEKYVSAVFNIGIKMMFIYILVGIGSNLATGWAAMVSNANEQAAMESYIAITLASFFYFKLCAKLPDYATAMLTGSFSLNFIQPKSPILVAGAMAYGAVKNAQALKTVAAKAGGTVSAVGASIKAGQKQSQRDGLSGIKGAAATGVNAIKTFGRAMMRTQARDAYKGTKNTFGGKVADDVKADSYYRQWKHQQDQTKDKP